MKSVESFMILVTYTIEPGKREAFVDEIVSSGLLEQIRHEKGCLSYDYYSSDQEEEILLLVEKWDSVKHQRIHMQQPHMEQLKKIKDRYVRDTKLERFFPLSFQLLN